MSTYTARGKAAYERDVHQRPTLPNGAPRTPWGRLPVRHAVAWCESQVPAYLRRTDYETVH